VKKVAAQFVWLSVSCAAALSILNVHRCSGALHWFLLVFGAGYFGWIAQVAFACRQTHMVRSNRGDFMREVLDTWDSILKYEPQLADEHAIACEWLTKTWTVAELAEPAKSGLTIAEMQRRKRGVKP
jgi:hypothetical protein